MNFIRLASETNEFSIKAVQQVGVRLATETYNSSLRLCTGRSTQPTKVEFRSQSDAHNLVLVKEMQVKVAELACRYNDGHSFIGQRLHLWFYFRLLACTEAQQVRRGLHQHSSLQHKKWPVRKTKKKRRMTGRTHSLLSTPKIEMTRSLRGRKMRTPTHVHHRGKEPASSVHFY